MNGILASAHLLASSPTLCPEERDCVDIVIDSSNAMTRLLDDLLLCTRMGTGRFELAPSPTRIDKLVKSINDVMLSRLQPSASMMMMHRSNSGGGGGVASSPPLPPPRVRWHVVTDPALPTAIMVDADRVKQVLLNLTDNALKVRSHFLRRTVGLLRCVGATAPTYSVVIVSLALLLLLVSSPLMVPSRWKCAWYSHTSTVAAPSMATTAMAAAAPAAGAT